MAIRRTLRIPPRPRSQRGVVLYVALILLILLTLLGIAGMQVSSMQERMSAGWRAGNLAFQNAESETKDREIEIAATIGQFAADDARCSSFDAGAWAEAGVNAGVEIRDSFVRRVDQCNAGGGIGMGQRPESEDTNSQFQISAFATDSVTIADDRTAEAVVDTIFIP
ncbi:MAG: protein PilX [Arenimonas sp.]|nr:protein PilX [Arenimonas sp.]